MKAIQKVKDRLNCPNCGAPIRGAECEYCGTLFYDFAQLEVGKAGYVRLKVGDNLLIFRALTTQVDIEQHNDSLYYADNRVVESYSAPGGTTINISMELLSDDRGVLLEKRNPKWAKGEQK